MAHDDDAMTTANHARRYFELARDVGGTLRLRIRPGELRRVPREHSPRELA
jgi:hypothetical protein